MTHLAQIILDIISEIQDMKRVGRTLPDYATQDEIFNSLNVEVMEALRDLYRQGRIEFHKTVNHIPMFGIKQE